jgi:hypothetical protein
MKDTYRVLLTHKENKLNNLFEDAQVFNIVWSNLQYDNLDDQYTVTLIDQDEFTSLVDDWNTSK